MQGLNIMHTIQEWKEENQLKEKKRNKKKVLQISE